MNERPSGQGLSGLLALLLFAVFALSVLSVLLGGTEIYSRLSRRDDDAWSRRTVIQYLTTKVRQSDACGSLTVEPFGQGDALVLTQELDGETFLTRVYCHEGSLRELFSPASVDSAPEDGEALLPLESLELHLDQGLLSLSVTEPDGAVTDFSLHLRSDREGTP